MLRVVAGMVPRTGRGRAVLVAVDGRDGAGKTMFADELAAALHAGGRTAVRASVDDFHHPRAHRHRRGRGSALGYWLDAFDLDRLATELLVPLGPGGAGRVRTAVHDLRADTPVHRSPEPVAPGSVLVLDGVFLHRDELRHYFDFSIYLQVDMATAFGRMAARDGTPAGPTDPHNARYAGAQRIYAAACRPADRAAVVIDNTDLAAPRIVGGRK